VRYMQETTEWEGNTPNHIYILEDGRGGRMLGYIKAGTTDPIWNARPAPFDRKHRTFKELKHFG